MESFPDAVIRARSLTKYNLMVPRKWFSRSNYGSIDAVSGVNERPKRAYRRAYDRAMMDQMPLLQKHLRPWLISENQTKKHIIICPQLYFTVLIC